MVLCGVPWSTYTWALYKKIRMDQFTFFYMLIVEPAPFVENAVFFPLDGFSSLVEDQVTIGMWVHFCVFNSFFIIIFNRYFLHLNFQCYPESSLYPPSCPVPQPNSFLALAFSCTRANDLCKTKSLSSHWRLTRPSSATYTTRDTAVQSSRLSGSKTPT